MAPIRIRSLAVLLVVTAGCSSVMVRKPPGRSATATATATAHAADAGTASTATPASTAPPTAGRAGVPSVAGFDCANIPAPIDACTADGDAVDALMARIACGPAPSAPSAASPRGPRWDKTSAPVYLDRVEQRFGLTADEKRRLFADGVVVPERLDYASYVEALADVHRSELPVYVSVDAVMNAVYVSNDRVIASVEAETLAPALEKLLAAMHDKLKDEPTRYPRETAQDLDVYLSVARALLEGDGDGAGTGTGTGTGTAGSLPALVPDAEVRALVGLVKGAGGLARVRLFGRDRMMELGAFRPRGHYASAFAPKNPGGADLSSWFRAAMWLSRVELNLVSRSSRSSSPSHDPTETPREATMALALADLAERAGALDDVDKLDGAWAALSGRREDVSIADLRRLAASAGITSVASPDAPARLRAAIGDGFVRTARTHFQAEPSPSLPVIATLLGPRITADTSVTRPLSHPEVRERYEVPAVEMAYALGHDRALAHLGRELGAFPALRGPLDRARDVAFGRVLWNGNKPEPAKAPERDLYSAWFGAIRGLSERPAGALPSFTETDAYRDMRVASAVAAYGQIRHNYVLLVPTTMEEGGCEIPDGYVEPAPATYRALIDYADRGAHAMLRFDDAWTARYFENLGKTLRVLSHIADRELAGEPLRDEERRFLSLVAERVKPRRGGYAPQNLFDGWYYGLHRSPEDALDDAKLVADYFASVNTGTVDYAGVKGARMGLFVIDSGGGKPRVAVGPVTRAFQARGPIAPRFADDDVDRMTTSSPWSASYTSPKAAEPAFTLKTAHGEANDEGIVLVATSTADVGSVTIALLDHHRVPVATLTKELRGAPGRPASARFHFTDYAVRDPEIAQLGVEGIHVSRGDFHFVDGGVKQWELESGDERWDFGPGKSRPPRQPRAAPGPTGRGRRL